MSATRGRRAGRYVREAGACPKLDGFTLGRLSLPKRFQNTMIDNDSHTTKRN